MTLLRSILALWAAASFCGQATRAAEALPPLVATTATTTLDSGGRPWAYLILDQNRPGLIAGHRFAIYVKTAAAGAFVSRGPVVSTGDPAVIGVMLSRGASVGDSLPALEAQLIALHALLSTPPGGSPRTNAPAMTLAQRIAAIQARTVGDTSLGALLDLYGLAHPALRMVRGTAWAGRLEVPLGTVVTIEVREIDPTGRDVAVIGRVTLHAGQPDRLPAPGPLAVVPDSTAIGDLAVRLRWATPDVLRRAGTVHHGDAAWRVTEAFATANGFDKTIPTASTLDGFALSAPSAVRRLAGPIFPAKLFDASNVADFTADRTNSYVADDNGRYSGTGIPFTEGSRNYYFAAAEDPLGRPGDVSLGILATVCRRIPPLMPTRIKVGIRWDSTNHTYWDVSWAANLPGFGTPTTRYELFRGNDFAQLTLAQRGQLDLEVNPIVPGDPLAIQRIAVVDHPDGTAGTIMGFHLPSDSSFGKTWWFAIRAVHGGPPGCGDLYSALSPPQLSTLHDTKAPVDPYGTNQPPPTTDCLRVACIVDSNPMSEVVAGALDLSVAQYAARCRREPGIGSAHFRVTDTVDGSVVVPETAVVFPSDEDVVEIAWTLPLSKAGDLLKVECEAEAFGPYTSDWVASSAVGISPAGNHRMTYAFYAGAIAESERVAFSAGNRLFGSLSAGCAATWPANTHLVVSPATGQILHPRFNIPLGVTTKQYRLYRRIEDGPLTLVAQGLQSYSGPGSMASAEDKAPPVSNGRVHYFSQILDENSVPGVMRHLGNLKFTGDRPPVPVLVTPVAADFGGTLTAPTVTLSWLVPPEHAERFEVFFATEQPKGFQDPHISALVAHLTPKQLPVPTVWKVKSSLDALNVLATTAVESFLTGRVGGDLGPGPRFTVSLKVDPTLKYKVWLRAIGPDGEPSDPSRSVEFQWQPPAAPPANIAWPARPLPPVVAFNSGIQVIDFRALPASRTVWSYSIGGISSIPLPSVAVDATPIGIRVGSVTVNTDSSKGGFDQNPPKSPIFFASRGSLAYGKVDPNKQVFTREGDAKQALMPCVLYRSQVANDRFPNVSGDVIQCSPLVNSIAWIPALVDGVPVAGELADPLFRWIGPDYPAVPLLDLYLVDTQPVVRGARYRYWLVRFSNLGEPIQTVPCGEVTVTTP